MKNKAKSDAAHTVENKTLGLLLKTRRCILWKKKVFRDGVCKNKFGNDDLQQCLVSIDKLEQRLAAIDEPWVLFPIGSPTRAMSSPTAPLRIQNDALRSCMIHSDAVMPLMIFQYVHQHNLLVCLLQPPARNGRDGSAS